MSIEEMTVKELRETGKWKEYVIPEKFKKWAGKTMFMVYVNDYSYVSEFLVKVNDPIVRKMAEAVIAHKEFVDPYSWE